MSDHVADMLDRMAAALEVRAAEPSSYYEWLIARDYKVDRYEYASHKQFLDALAPAQKALKALLDAHARGENFPVTKFSKQEADTLRAALAILEKGSVPLALLKVQKEEDPLIL